jgi:hypothetical protein
VLISQLINGISPTEDLGPFNPQRFGEL